MSLAIQDLQDENFDTAEEWQIAMDKKLATEEDKKVAKNDTRKANKRIKKLSCAATSRLAKWRAERDARRETEDELARIAQESKTNNEVLERYKAAVEASEGKKKQMKKEWKNDEAASRKGGGRSWPVPVVQMICELLVNGTPPTAIPGNIRTMYETLYGE